MSPEEKAVANERLRAEGLPPSLDEVRQRKMSIKEENRVVRTNAVEFIRKRTISRLEAKNRPTSEELGSDRQT